MEILFYGIPALILLAASLVTFYRLEQSVTYDKYQNVLDEAAMLAVGDDVEFIFDTKHRDNR